MLRSWARGGRAAAVIAVLLAAGCVGGSYTPDPSGAPPPETVSPAERPSPAEAPVATGPGSADTRPGIAVFPLDNGGSYGESRENLELLGVGLQQALMYELQQNTNLRVVDRAVLRDLMQEQDLGASGRVDAETAARIGRIVGAKYVVAGSFIDLFGDFQLTGRIVDAETTEILESAQARGRREQLYDLIVNMAAEVTADVKLPALPAQIRDARKGRRVPPEALVRHAMILGYTDEGRTDRAIELYVDLIADFPQVVEWQAELRQLRDG